MERLAEMTAERDQLKASLIELNTLLNLADSRILELETGMAAIVKNTVVIQQKMIQLKEALLKNSALQD
jgi:hypothetical protein